jgi:predicted O-methyltransferase YrrM
VLFKKNLPEKSILLNTGKMIIRSILNLLPQFKKLNDIVKAKETELTSLKLLLQEIQNEKLKLEQHNNNLKDEKYALLVEREKIDESSKFATPGHYYSPIPSIDSIKLVEEKIWGSFPTSLPAINLNTEEQLAYINYLSKYYPEIPFSEEKKEGLRYYANNIFYPWTDGIVLYSMIRHLNPKKIIEIGSGYSSAVMMDTNDLFFNGEISLRFIEPNPERLHSLIRNDDHSKYTIHQNYIQDIDISIFEELEENDILFIDSSHVSKIYSDLNKIIFDILPKLKPGVFIHFHDVFYPFEYHKEWIYKGVVWNEAYMLRAFLQFNNEFKIVFWNTYLFNFYKEHFRDMPKCMEGPGGNFWIQKI